MTNSNGKGKGWDALEVDAEREQAGEWYELDGEAEGIRVKLRSPFCDDYQRFQGFLQQKRKAYTPGGDADLLLLDKINRESIGHELLIGWEGDERWPALEPWTQELAVKLMVEHKYRKVSGKISTLVRRLSNDEEVARVEQGKDSALPSDTASI